jgi:hypothetical protein
VSEIADGSTGMVTAMRGDVAGLAEAAKILIEQSEHDPEFRALTRAGAVARFSLEARTRDLEAIFLSLIDELSPVWKLSA